MKQEITAQELQELTEGQLKELIKWWDARIKKDNNAGAPTMVGCYIKASLYFVPLLSIGLCIEFLIDKNELDIVAVYFGTIEMRSRRPLLKGNEGELIDTLWKIVKVVLANE